MKHSDLPHDIVHVVLEELALISPSDCSSVSLLVSWAHRLAMPHLLRHVLIKTPREAQLFYPRIIGAPDILYPPSVVQRLALVRTLAIDPTSETMMLFEPLILHFIPNLRRILVSYTFLHVMANPSKVAPRQGLDMTIYCSNVALRGTFAALPPLVRGQATMLSAVTHLHLPATTFSNMPNLSTHLPLLTHLAAGYTERVGLEVPFPADQLTMLVFLAPVAVSFDRVLSMRTKIVTARRTGKMHVYYGEWRKSFDPVKDWDLAGRSESLWERARRLTELVEQAYEATPKESRWPAIV